MACGRRLGAWLAAYETTAVTGAATIAPLGRGLSPQGLVELRNLMSQVMGPMRDGARLAGAGPVLDRLASAGWQGRLARALVDAAVRRRASLGAHWREDAESPGAIGCTA